MTQAPEMPAQIWAYPQGEQSTRGRWHNVPVQNADAVEYRRADLPPTEAECLRNEKVRALVEAVRNEREARSLYLSTAPDRGGAHGPKGQRKAALEAAQFATVRALAALEQESGHE